MLEMDIYHAKFGHSGMKNKEVMTDLVLLHVVVVVIVVVLVVA